MTSSWFDFNEVDTLEPPKISHDIQAIKETLHVRLLDVLARLFPQGHHKRDQFFIGDIDGTPGKSLVVELTGEKCGLWYDFATGERGDVFDLWAAYERLDVRTQFSSVLTSIERWLGQDVSQPLRSSDTKTTKNNKVMVDDLGPPTAKWDYFDAHKQLIACVYRYDTPTGKEFRPWDVKARKHRAPHPRPLYNLPAIVHEQQIIFVEGEKCADALIDKGIVASTAMNGAHSPVEKTDWSALIDKDVLIWPDNDDAGRDYALRVAQTLMNVGARSIQTLDIPNTQSPKWDAADAIEDGIDIPRFIACTPKIAQRVKAPFQAFSLGDLLKDTSPFPEDLIAPRVLTPGGMVVFGGAPKVGKSDFVLSWLTHMAAGEPFLNLKPTRRLRVFYLQAEVQYHYLRERLKNMQLPELMLWKASDNLLITPQLRFVLNDVGIETVEKVMRESSKKEPIDIIVIDPLRNVFDGGGEGLSENDNQAMLFFLQQRVEKLRDAINPDAGIILVHHTKKLAKRHVIEDPFLSFSGASSLRGYYTTGMLLYRPDENESHRVVTFELRNGAPIPDKTVSKKNGKWIELDPESHRLTHRDHGEKLDAERRRKQDVILQLIFDQASKGHVYTLAQFAEAFEGRAGLGATRTILDRLSVLSTKGCIKFFKDYDHYGLPRLPRTKFGYMCVEQMRIGQTDSGLDSSPEEAVGELSNTALFVRPSIYKCPKTGAAMPVENPEVWVYQDALMTANAQTNL